MSSKHIKNFGAILILFFILSRTEILSQSIQASYIINFRPITELKDTSSLICGHYAKVCATYEISDIADTTLKFEVLSIFNNVAANNLGLEITDKQGHIIPTNDYSYKYVNGILTLNFNRRIANYSIKCQYDYIGDATSVIVLHRDENINFKNKAPKTNLSILGGAHSFSENTSMFFVNSKYEIEHKSIKIVTPNDSYFTSSLETKKASENIYDCILDKKYDDINRTLVFSILDTSIYAKINFSPNVNCYIRKDSIEKCKNNFDTINNVFDRIDHFNKFFENRKTVDIVEFDYHVENMSCGITRNNSIFVDFSFLTRKNINLIHEYLHTKIGVPKINSKGFYIMEESMIEYLANYFMYSKDSLKYSLALEYKNSQKEKALDTRKKISFYDLNENSYDVYINGYLLIYHFAKQIGEDKFVESLIKFYNQNNCNAEYTYDGFIDFLRNEGISKKSIDDFDKKVKEIN